MEKQIRHIAAEIKTELQQNPDAGRRALEKFARSYGFSKKLTHAALVLNLNYSKADGDTTRQELIRAMTNLVDEVVTDHQKHFNDAKQAQLVKARTRLSETFLQQNLPNEVVFSCEKMKRTYRKSNFTLGDINIQLKLGEITGVVGENGNGKTTLFRIVAGELQHDTGEVTYPLFDPSGTGKRDWVTIKNNISYVPQELSPMYGSLKNSIKYEAALHGIKGPQNEEEVNYIIHRLGLEEHLGKSWSELSGGFKLRFALARALVWKPRLLIIDEPLANLDIKTQLIVLQDLRELSRSLRFPMSILISSQHLHEIEAVSDKILFLEQGSVAFYDQTEMLGKARSGNTFELGCDQDLNGLKRVLEGIPDSRVSFNGVAFVIQTPLTTTERELIYHLLLEDIHIHYFRDISRSVKSLFKL